MSHHPHHRLLPNNGGIELHGWTIVAAKKGIWNSAEMQKATQELDLTLPEMVFGHNSLRLTHAGGLDVEFVAVDALKLVNNHAETVKVSYAVDWAKSRTKDISSIPEAVKPYDWTFTTDYAGSVRHQVREPETTAEAIDIEKLKKPDPILFYDEIVLFEDELADNGQSQLSLKIRVMHNLFLVLLRFFLRVDNVLVRVIDSRYVHEFATDYVLHEQSFREENYESIESKMKPGMDKSMLANVNWLCSVMPVVRQTTRKLSV